MSPTSFLLLLLLPLLAFAAQTPKYGDCVPKSCNQGEGPIITFPFWINGFHPPSCGHHLFTVTCNQSLPSIKFGSEQLMIHHIDYHRKTLNVSKPSPLNSRGNCSVPAANLTLVPTYFKPSDGWLYISSGCNDSRWQSQGGKVVACGNWKYYVGNWSCGGNVVKYPAPDPVVSDMNNWVQGGYGFGLSWTGLDCSDCVGSGGECGYNKTTSGPMCICRDGVHASDCFEDAGGHSTGKMVIIILASTLVGFLLLACVLFLGLKYAMENSSSCLGTFLRRKFNKNYIGRELEPLRNQFQAHIFSYKELEEATCGFAASREIGDGGFGTVYKGKLRDGRVVAVKRLYESNYRRMEQFLNEVSIFNHVRHKNLVNFYGCTNYHSRGLLLVYEYIPNGTVADHLYGSRTDEALTWPMRMKIAMETAEVLAYLHAVEPPIIHRDIKTSNILLDDHYHAKVADFGLSRLLPLDASYVSTVPQGTPGYLDPEYHRYYRLTDKSDVYSFGVVLAELISSKPAVDISRNTNEISLADMTINKIQSCLLHELVDHALGFEVDPEARRMIEEVAMLAFRCLQTEKDLRPAMEEVFEELNHIQNKGEKHDIFADAGKGVQEDTHLLRSAKNSPVTVHAPWVSRSTTPSSSH